MAAEVKGGADELPEQFLNKRIPRKVQTEKEAYTMKRNKLVRIGAWSMLLISGALMAGGAFWIIIIATFFGNPAVDTYRSSTGTLMPLLPWHIWVFDHIHVASGVGIGAFLGGTALFVIIAKLLSPRKSYPCP